MEVGGYVGHRIPHWIASALETVIKYDGDVAVGETVTIDTDALTVENNGVNTRPDFLPISEWLQIDPGETISFKYYDDEASRTVDIEIIKEDQHI